MIEKKKRMNSKSKGNTFERAIANEFSERWNDTFKRVPQSGAIVGGLNRIKMHMLREDAQEILCGDIICPRWFPFSVELKNYGLDNGPNMYTILESDSIILEKWLEQAKGDAVFARKKYMILFNITRRSCFAVVDYGDFVQNCIKSIDDMPKKFMIYKTSIILDKTEFLNKYIEKYFPKEKRSNKTEEQI